MSGTGMHKCTNCGMEYPCPKSALVEYDKDTKICTLPTEWPCKACLRMGCDIPKAPEWMKEGGR